MDSYFLSPHALDFSMMGFWDHSINEKKTTSKSPRWNILSSKSNLFFSCGKSNRESYENTSIFLFVTKIQLFINLARTMTSLQKLKILITCPNISKLWHQHRNSNVKIRNKHKSIWLEKSKRNGRYVSWSPAGTGLFKTVSRDIF